MAEWKNLGEKAKNLTLTGLGKAKDLGESAKPGQCLRRGEQEEGLCRDRQVLRGRQPRAPRGLRVLVPPAGRGQRQDSSQQRPAL